ncbi:MAG: transcription-repair coupling factor [Pseudomonadota bacterium]
MNKLAQLPEPNTIDNKQTWGNVLPGISSRLICDYVQTHQLPLIIITADNITAAQLTTEIEYYLKQTNIPVMHFPDRETLPYDIFSPNQEIISARLQVLNQLPHLNHAIVIAALSTLMHYLTPIEFIGQTSFSLACGDALDLVDFQRRLALTNYNQVEQVYAPGEFSVRGSLIDVFPMGSINPFRIDLFDNEIDSIRTFDIETQRTIEKIQSINLLPGNEFPLTEESIKQFRNQWRSRFRGNPLDCSVYQDISNGMNAAGIEYYLPLFFSNDTLIDFSRYLPANSIVVKIGDLETAATHFWQEITERFEQKRVDITRPLVSPHELFLTYENFNQALRDYKKIKITADDAKAFNIDCEKLIDLAIDRRAKVPLHRLKDFIVTSPKRICLITESAGRREALLELLKPHDITPDLYDHWQNFIDSESNLGLIIAPQSYGYQIASKNLAVITETELFGEHAVLQRRREKRKWHDPDAIIRDLSELQIGSPVVHIEYGIGRYQGLKILTLDGETNEFLILEYAGNDKLYIPVTSLNLISRYTGAQTETVALNKLGTDNWEKTKRKAAAKIRDVAAELLQLYAAREAKTGFVFNAPDEDYYTFASSFPFELTLDQEKSINALIKDMTTTKSMDRLICGDVGFGKTEVAMRAAYLAVSSGKQVAILVPTTLLAQQHYQNFADRFADWPIQVEVLSRFKSPKQTKLILDDIQAGKVDIVIGTHKLLQKTIKFADLGLLIVDEEHRFGVKQKDKIKQWREEVDILTLTATPIPRTLNMSMSGIRDLSIIATPPAKRLAIKTFVKEKKKAIVREAILREIMRGGQVYYLHNSVATIQAQALQLQELLPDVRLAVAHGQMPERELERIMSDFYHHRYNVLLCTTIIESGIDIPTANTIIIDRADKFGLAQLHQLRGRVGRSHHQAYAYLLTPAEETITKDAKKRLEAIASFEDLGAGFILATHDLEIRGAGELLGEEQSGHIQALGFSLYMDLLDRAVKALQAGENLDLDETLKSGVELNLKIPAYIPEIYIADIHQRLILYKRISNTLTPAEIKDLQVEMIDRFGLLPEATKNLFAIADLRLLLEKLGIKSIEADTKGGVIEFDAKPKIDPKKIIQLIQQQPDRFKLSGQDKLRFAFPTAIQVHELPQQIETVIKRLVSVSSV